jgi:hypothetical protein
MEVGGRKTETNWGGKYGQVHSIVIKCYRGSGYSFFPHIRWKLEEWVLGFW